MTTNTFESQHRALSGKRSRRYPSISLGRCIELVQTLYDIERRNPAPVSEVARHWGYSSHTSGSASSTYAAVRTFGLIVEEGRGDYRQARVSETGIEILRSPDPEAAISAAFLAPQVHLEMWERYGFDLPSERSLVWTLTKEMGFTDKGAGDFAKQYHESLDYVKAHGDASLLGVLSSKDAQSHTDDDELTGKAKPKSDFPVPPAAPVVATSGTVTAAVGLSGTTVTRIPIQLGDGQQIVIEGEFPVSPMGWSVFKAVLDAMKPGLVSEPAAVPAATADASQLDDDVI